MGEQELHKIIQEYFVSKPVKRVQLFGSYARNEAHENSDIDLVLTMEHPVGLFKLASYKLELEKMLKKRVDLATEASLPKEFHAIIKKDLATIYERD